MSGGGGVTGGIAGEGGGRGVQGDVLIPRFIRYSPFKTRMTLIYPFNVIQGYMCPHFTHINLIWSYLPHF